uniref:Uncharacterized protein n=1 Tax=Phlebotomus papatasi TaxID=29031 RepID=A0A1B0GQR8_PHLPP
MLHETSKTCTMSHNQHTLPLTNFWDNRILPVRNNPGHGGFESFCIWEVICGNFSEFAVGLDGIVVGIETGDPGRWNIETPPPDLNLLLSIHLGHLSLIESCQTPIVPLIEPPGLMHRNLCAIHLAEDQFECLIGSLLLLGFSFTVPALTEAEIMKFNLPNSIPFYYDLDETMKPVGKIKFLADDKTVISAMNKVASIDNSWTTNSRSLRLLKSGVRESELYFQNPKYRTWKSLGILGVRSSELRSLDSEEFWSLYSLDRLNFAESEVRQSGLYLRTPGLQTLEVPNF